MKSENTIRNRLKKLRVRYTKNYMRKTQSRIPKNCVHNFEHKPNGARTLDFPGELELSPRINRTLVVVQDDSSIRLCKFYEGDVCDTEETSKSCPKFESRVNEKEALHEFSSLLKNDDYVMSNYRDVATLQWVLGERVYQTKFTYWGRFNLWLRSVRLMMSKSKSTDVESLPKLPEGLWNDNGQNPGS